MTRRYTDAELEELHDTSVLYPSIFQYEMFQRAVDLRADTLDQWQTKVGDLPTSALLRLWEATKGDMDFGPMFSRTDVQIAIGEELARRLKNLHDC